MFLYMKSNANFGLTKKDIFLDLFFYIGISLYSVDDIDLITISCHLKASKGKFWLKEASV